MLKEQYAILLLVHKEINPMRSKRGSNNPDVSYPVLMDASNDPNFRSYESILEDLKRDHMGEYVAFVEGDLVDHDVNRERLISRVYQTRGTMDMLVQKVQETRKVVKFRRPFEEDAAPS